MYRSKTVNVRCFVPSCKNSTTNSRNKVFVLVRETLKRKWCEKVNVEYNPKRRMLCCEDHLILEEDLENYVYFKLMQRRPTLKSTAKLRLGKDSKSCDTDESDKAPTLKKLLLLPNLPGVPNDYERKGQTETAKNHLNNVTPTVSSASTHNMKIDSAAQRRRVKVVDQSDNSKSIMQTKQLSPSLKSSISLCEATSHSLPSTDSFNTESSSSTTTFSKDLFQTEVRKQTLQCISSKPEVYIGLPKQYSWLINHIVTQSITKITGLDIIISLFKIKLNDPINRICDQFQISKVKYLQSLHNGIQALAHFFQNLIYMPTLLEIKENQPYVFKTSYPDVCLFLDVIEIGIQRPQNYTSQTKTLSQYKHMNTVKYLVGSTPNGFISFVSKGYGGSISDKILLEKSGLIDFLPDNAVIMSNRGFREIEALLMVKGITLLLPPRGCASNKPATEEVFQAVVVANLRAHIEKVSERVREFRFLKPHSVIFHKYVGYLDNIVLIACGLVNLQNELK